MEQKAYHVDITGRVTGVGFRFFAIERAEYYGQIQGWVRNVGYGRVEVVCQGNDSDLKLFLHDLSCGPAFGRVDEIKINEIPVSELLTGFHIR